MPNKTNMVLAVFVKQLAALPLCYTIDGKWVQIFFKHVKFRIPGFMLPKDIECLLPFVPPRECDKETTDKVLAKDYAVPRNVSIHIIEKLRSFWKESYEVYR